MIRHVCLTNHNGNNWVDDSDGSRGCREGASNECPKQFPEWLPGTSGPQGTVAGF